MSGYAYYTNWLRKPHHVACHACPHPLRPSWGTPLFQGVNPFLPPFLRRSFPSPCAEKECLRSRFPCQVLLRDSSCLRAPGISGRGASQLWSWVCSSSVFVLRRAGGPVSFRGVCSSSVFVLRRAGGPVSFRGCEGGSGASQLWSCLVLRGMEASQLPGCDGGSGASQLWSCLVLRGMELPGL